MSLAIPAENQYRADLHIDGEWRAGGRSERFPVHNPATGELLAEFAVATEADCLAAVDAAERARPDWADRAPRERSEILRAAFELLRSEATDLAELIVAENGKAFPDAMSEAVYATEFFRWFSEEAVRVGGDYRLAPSGDKRIVVTRQPIGVSVLITPWNFPAAMATRKIAPALAAGCPVVLKPAAETPLTAAYVVAALTRAGVPAGVVNLVTPDPPGPAVRAMLGHDAVRKLSFTGSTVVGRELLRVAADRVISTSMELGGNAPFLVLPGADLAAAVEGALTAKMRNGGAACTAANRFYVHSSVLTKFTQAMIEALQGFRMGPGHDRENNLGALVSEVERNKVASLVSGAVETGARIELGGTSPTASAFYPPTILSHVRHGTAITRNEIFGPVVSIIEYDDVTDAIRMANDTEHGLIAYVFGDAGQALEVAQRLDAGMVAVNRGVLSDPAAPFGGMKQSGLGREGGLEGIDEYLEQKYIALSS